MVAGIFFDPMQARTAGLSIETLAQKAGLTRPGWTYDTALPQTWVDRVHEATGIYPTTLGIVWSYSPESIFGAPFALTPQAHILLTWARSLGIA